MASQLSVEEKFEQFNFGESQLWQSYIINLFPSPKIDQLKKIKRKWYKNHIDSELLLEKPEVQKEKKEQDQQYDAQQPNQQQETKWVQIIYKLEGNLKMLYFPLYFILPRYKIPLVIIICILALLRQLKFPRFNIEYGRQLFINEFFQNILFIIPFAMENYRSIFFDLPIFIHFWMGTAEFIYRQQFFFYRFINGIIDQTRAGRNQILLMKIKFEINLIFIIIVMTIARQLSLLTLFLYVNYLRIKYLSNPTMQFGFRELDVWINGVLHHRYCPSLFAFIYSKIRTVCGYMVKTPQQQQ